MNFLEEFYLKNEIQSFNIFEKIIKDFFQLISHSIQEKKNSNKIKTAKIKIKNDIVKYTRI